MRTTEDPSTPAKKAPAKAPSLTPPPVPVEVEAQLSEAPPEATLLYAADPVSCQAQMDALIADGGFPQSVSAAPDGGFWVLAVRLPE